MQMVLRWGSLDDDGVTWSNEKVLYPESDAESDEKRRPMNAVPIVVDKDHIILMFNTFPEETSEGDVTENDPPRWGLLMKHSYDGGKTWEASQELPVKDIFSGFADVCGIPSYCAVGPGHGISIRLKNGKLRLVVSGNVSWPKSKHQQSQLFAIISDDDDIHPLGSTWHMGGSIPLPTLKNGNKLSGNECQPVDMGSEKVVINCRTPGTYPRMQCYSDDGCDTFTHSEFMHTLIEPEHGCQGSTIGFKAPSSNDDTKPWALFSNPNCKESRRNLSVRLSKDGCKTWSNPPIIVLEPQDSAYSDLAVFTQNGKQKFACLFERLYEHHLNINFIMFTIDKEL